MDAAPGVPGSFDEALDREFDAAIKRTLRHAAIRPQADHLGISDDDLSAQLTADRTEILAAVTDKVAALRQLYRRRSQLAQRLRSQAGSTPLGRFAKESGGRRTQQRLEMTPEGKLLTESIRTTTETLQTALTLQAMIPLLRLWLNRQRQQHEERTWNYRRHLDKDVDTTELRGPVTQTSFVLTELLASLGRLLARIPGGSIGVAGPRGSGKSTALENVELILAAGKGKRTWRLFNVRVPAPVEYVPREFLVHLHDEICTAWLLEKGVPPSAGSPPSRTTERLRRLWDVATIVVPVLLAVVGVWLIAGHTIDNGLPSLENALPLVFTLATVAGSAVLGTWIARQLSSEDRYSDLHIVASVPFDPLAELFVVPSGATRKYVLFVTGTVVALSVLALLYAGGSYAWLDAYRASGLALLVISIFVLLIWLTTDPLAAGQSRTFSGRYLKAFVMTSVSAAALTMAVQGLGLVLASQLYDASVGALVAGGGLAAAAAALAGLRTGPPAAIGDELEFSDPSVAMAVRHQRRLRYQRTQESGWTAGAKLGSSGASVESGTSGSVSDVEQPLTVPEITRMMRDLLTQIRRDGSEEEDFEIVICIDELDKLEGEEGAKTFLNEIKGVFTIPDVIFLVSVSEEAMAGFERRGLEFRDVFDSAFDEIIHVPQLTLPETANLVGNRISNVPRPFVALAHCLSAGLARDVIRALDHMTDAAAPQSLPRVTRAVIHRELYGKWQAVVSAVRPIPLEPQVTDMIKALYVIDLCPGLESVEDRCVARGNAFDELANLRMAMPESSELEQFRNLQRLGGEYLGLTYFCRTLIELFDLESDDALERFIDAEQADRLARHSLEYLTRARQHLGVNPRLAWEQLSFFRVEHGMRQVEFPVALLGSPAGIAVVGTQEV